MKPFNLLKAGIIYEMRNCVYLGYLMFNVWKAPFYSSDRLWLDARTLLRQACILLSKHSGGGDRKARSSRLRLSVRGNPFLSPRLHIEAPLNPRQSILRSSQHFFSSSVCLFFGPFLKLLWGFSTRLMKSDGTVSLMAPISDRWDYETYERPFQP